MLGAGIEPTLPLEDRDNPYPFAPLPDKNRDGCFSVLSITLPQRYILLSVSRIELKKDCYGVNLPLTHYVASTLIPSIGVAPIFASGEPTVLDF